MKLLNEKITKEYHEIEIEESFLFFKWKSKYRKSNGRILKFKKPNKYYHLGFMEYVEIHEIFVYLEKKL